MVSLGGQAMSFKNNGIIILLGAGCSADAGIPTSMEMIGEIETLISKGSEEDNFKWSEYKALYNCIKSSILYGEGIRGAFEHNANYNIEKLVNTLSELNRRDDHPLFPFVGTWTTKLLEVAGSDFNKIKSLRENILKKLKAWVTISDYGKANYYSCLFKFQNEFNFPFRVFSLNYDLCLEKHIGESILERGFDENREWNWRRFEDNENASVDIYLYKMHGSIDWDRRSDGILTYSDEIAQIPQPDLIFGTNYKLQYIDPYLFYAYEFRRYTLESQLIVTIGYGFGDEHINGIIQQSLRTDPKRIIFCITKAEDKFWDEKQKQIFHSLYNINRDQIIMWNMSAKSFLITKLSINELRQIIPEEENLIK